MKIRVQIAALLLVLASACAHRMDAPVPSDGAPPIPLTAPGQFEVTTRHISRGITEAREVCWAAANARNANWTGLWWNPERGGDSVCALAPRSGNVATPTLMEAYSCEDEAIDLCNELPTKAPTNATEPVAIHQHADGMSQIIGQVGLGEQVTVIERMSISSYSHRGIVRRATNSLHVGDVVFPWREDDPLPWRPQASAPDIDFYHVLVGQDKTIDTVPIDPPHIEWMPLGPLGGESVWVLIETDGGVKGWASGDALQIDFHEPDEYE